MEYCQMEYFCCNCDFDENTSILQCLQTEYYEVLSVEHICTIVCHVYISLNYFFLFRALCVRLRLWKLQLLLWTKVEGKRHWQFFFYHLHSVICCAEEADKHLHPLYITC